MSPKNIGTLGKYNISGQLFWIISMHASSSQSLLHDEYSECGILNMHCKADQHSSDMVLCLIENICFSNNCARLVRQEPVRNV